MIKHRKIIICILLTYALFIVGIFNVKALNVTDFSLVLNYNNTIVNNRTCTINTTWTAGNENMKYPIFTGGTNCTLRSDITPNADYIIIPMIFSATESYPNGTNTINFINESIQVWMNSTGGDILCDYDGTFATCPFRIANAGRMTGLGITFAHGGGLDGVYYLRIPPDWAVANGNNTSVANNTGTIATNSSDINNKISDSSIDTNQTTTDTSNWSNMNASDNTITSLLTLPIQLLQAYTNGMSGTCSSFNLGNLFGTNITLPCINIGNLIGNSLWTTIDVLFSGFMIFAIAKKLIKIFNDFTNLRSNQVDELYGGGA